jgi:hypothetical protein
LGSHERIDIDSYDARLPKTTTLTYLGMLLPDIVVGSSVAVTSSNDQSLAHDIVLGVVIVRERCGDIYLTSHLSAIAGCKLLETINGEP